MPPYSWSPSSSSSPGPSGRERIAALSAVLAFGVKAMLSVSAPT